MKKILEVLKDLFGSGRIILTAVLIVMILAFFGVFKLNRGVRQDYNNLQDLLADTVNYYETQVLESGRVINTQEQVITNLNNALAASKTTAEELKERNFKKDVTIVHLKNKISLLEIQASYVPTPDTVVISDTVLPQGTIEVPKGFEYTDAWAKITGTVGLNRVYIQDITIDTEPKLYLGYQSQGFLKKAKPVVTVEDALDNPYVTTVGMQNVVIQSKPPFYNRPNWYRAEGAAGAIAIIELIKWIAR